MRGAAESSKVAPLSASTSTLVCAPFRRWLRARRRALWLSLDGKRHRSRLCFLRSERKEADVVPSGFVRFSAVSCFTWHAVFLIALVAPSTSGEGGEVEEKVVPVQIVVCGIGSVDVQKVLLIVVI